MSTFPYGFDAAKLRKARTAAGLSVARIAREVGVTDRAVSLYLAGSRVPRPELLPRLARSVGVAPAARAAAPAAAARPPRWDTAA